jgi:hypothetical protein
MTFISEEHGAVGRCNIDVTKQNIIAGSPPGLNNKTRTLKKRSSQPGPRNRSGSQEGTLEFTGRGRISGDVQRWRIQGLRGIYVATVVPTIWDDDTTAGGGAQTLAANKGHTRLDRGVFLLSPLIFGRPSRSTRRLRNTAASIALPSELVERGPRALPRQSPCN